MKLSDKFIERFCAEHKQGTVKIIVVNQEAIDDNIPSQTFLDWLDTHNQQILNLIGTTIKKYDSDVWYSNDEVHELLTELRQQIEEL